MIADRLEFCLLLVGLTECFDNQLREVGTPSKAGISLYERYERSGQPPHPWQGTDARRRPFQFLGESFNYCRDPAQINFCSGTVLWGIEA
jgi:hypothetical protein